VGCCDYCESVMITLLLSLLLLSYYVTFTRTCAICGCSEHLMYFVHYASFHLLLAILQTKKRSKND
jgi:hypothetical protein